MNRIPYLILCSAYSTCRPATLLVTAGTDIAVTAISAPAGAPLPDGVRPRSARESLHRLGTCP